MEADGLAVEFGEIRMAETRVLFQLLAGDSIVLPDDGMDIVKRLRRYTYLQLCTEAREVRVSSTKTASDSILVRGGGHGWAIMAIHGYSTGHSASSLEGSFRVFLFFVQTTT